MSKQLEALEKQRQQINARIQKAKAMESAKERKQDLRRKILIGEHFLKKSEQEGKLDTLYTEILTSIEKKNDRELFEKIG